MATFLDANRKDARRDHWDRVISKARADADEIDHQQESRLDSLSRIAEQAYPSNESTRGLVFGPADPSLRFCGGAPQWFVFPDMRSVKWTQVFDWADQQHRLRAATGLEEFRGVPFHLLQGLSAEQIEQFLNDDNAVRRFFSAGPDCSALQDEPLRLKFTTKSLKAQEWSTAMMVWQILSHCSESSTTSICRLFNNVPHSTDEVTVRRVLLKETRASKTRSFRLNLSQLPDQEITPHEVAAPDDVLDKAQIHDMIQLAKARLESLRQLDKNDENLLENFESPRLPIYGRNPKYRGRQASALNRDLFPMLSMMEHGMNLSPALSKICHALLTFPTAPTIQTYNLLLICFCRLRNRALVLAVWNAMRQSYVRPNEITYSTLLQFFTIVDDVLEFRKLVRLMKGYDRGVARLRASVKIEGMTAQRVRRIRYREHNEDLVLEKARMNSEVYETLIIGALKFMGEQTAMHYYKEMINEGWETTAKILSAILEDCCKKGDWEAGYLVWLRILTTAGQASQQAYEWMLRLCGECNKYHELFQVLEEGAYRGMLSSTMLNLLRNYKMIANRISAAGVKRLLEFAMTRNVLQTAEGQTPKSENVERSSTRAHAINARRKELFSSAPVTIEQHLMTGKDIPINDSLPEESMLQALPEAISQKLDTAERAPDSTGFSEFCPAPSSGTESAEEREQFEAEAGVIKRSGNLGPQSEVSVRPAPVVVVRVQQQPIEHLECPGSDSHILDARNHAPMALIASA